MAATLAPWMFIILATVHGPGGRPHKFIVYSPPRVTFREPPDCVDASEAAIKLIKRSHRRWIKVRGACYQPEGVEI
jgi:hypothetical protein